MTKKLISLVIALILALPQVGVFAEDVYGTPTVQEPLYSSGAVLVDSSKAAEALGGGGLQAQVATRTRLSYLKFDVSAYKDEFLMGEVTNIALYLMPSDNFGDANFTVGILDDSLESSIDYGTLTYNSAITAGVVSSDSRTEIGSSGIGLTKNVYSSSSDLTSGIKAHLDATTNSEIVLVIGSNAVAAFYNTSTGAVTDDPYLSVTTAVNITKRIADIKADLTAEKIGITDGKVTSKLSLVSKGLYDTKLTWSVSDSLKSVVNTSTGGVNRPLFGEEAIEGTITASFNVGGTNDSVVFDVTVPPLGENDEIIRWTDYTLNQTAEAMVSKRTDWDGPDAANYILCNSGNISTAFVAFDFTDHSSSMEQIDEMKFGLVANDNKNEGDCDFTVSILNDQYEQYINSNLTWTEAESKGITTGYGRVVGIYSGALVKKTCYYTNDIKNDVKEHLSNNTSNKTVVFAISETKTYPAAYYRNDTTYPPVVKFTKTENITQNVTDVCENLTFGDIKKDNSDIDSVTSDLNLITEGDNETTISWQSSNPAVIDPSNGNVHRNGRHDGNAVVELTATVGKSTVTRSKTFVVTVLEDENSLGDRFLQPAPVVASEAGRTREKDNSAQNMVIGLTKHWQSFARVDLSEHKDTIADAYSLQIRATANQDKDGFYKHNIAVCILPEEMETMTVPPAYADVSSDGNGAWNYETDTYATSVGINSPGTYYIDIPKQKIIDAMGENGEVVLKFYMSDGEVIEGDTTGGVLTLHGMKGTEAQKPAVVINYLKPNYEMDLLAINNIPSIATENLSLTTTGEYGSTITWTSSDENVISNTGEVRIDTYDEDNSKEDKIVTLTAVAESEKGSSERKFTVRVKRNGVIDASSDTYVSEAKNDAASATMTVGGTDNGVALVGFNLSAEEKEYIAGHGSRMAVLKLYSDSEFAEGKTVKVTPIDAKPAFDSLKTLTYSDALALESASNTYEYEGVFKNGYAAIDVSEYVRGLGDGYALFNINSEDTGFEFNTLEAGLGKEPKLLVSDKAYSVDYALSVAAAEIELDDLLADTDSAETVRRGLTLPTKGKYNSTIGWSALPTGIINTTDGTIERPASDTVVTLTATFTISGQTLTKDFVFNVVREETKEEFAEYLIGKLVVPDIVNKTITLPGADYTQESAVVTWSVVSGTAVSVADSFTLDVSRPKDSETSSTIRATLLYDDVTLTKDFAFTVLRTSEKNVIKNKTVISGDATARYALDDNLDTVWSISNTEVIVDMISAKAVTGFSIIPSGETVSSVQISTSRDGSTYTDIATSNTLKSDAVNYIDLEAPGSYARYIKFNISGGKIKEIAAYSSSDMSSSTTGDVFANLVVPTTVTGDFVLPSTAEGNTITWTSLTDKVTISGVNASVTIGSSKYSATIKASVTVDGVVKTKNYSVYVDKTSGSGEGGGGNGNGGSGGGLGGGGNIVDSVGNADPITPPAPTSSFDDLSTVTWATEYIEYLYDKGIVNGKGDGKFAPNDNLVREEFAKIIALGFEMKIDETSKNGFSDVISGEWYEDYINAIANAGITQGLGDGSFGVGKEISRQDVMVMVARILNISPSDGYVPDFSDSENIADYAYESICALAEIGIISGDELGNVNPTGSITRAEMSKIVFLALQR